MPQEPDLSTAVSLGFIAAATQARYFSEPDSGESRRTSGTSYG